jgi:hypothetical protein
VASRLKKVCTDGGIEGAEELEHQVLEGFRPS